MTVMFAGKSVSGAGRLAGFFVFAALVCSCIGAASDIRVRADGSGSVTLEYRMAKDLEKLGKLDGNERWLTVPVGRADLERSVRRIEGLRLVSFRAKEAGGDMVYTARLDFSSPAALAAFFDASGRKADIDMARRKAAFFFTGEFSSGREAFRSYVARSLSSYEFSLALQMPSGVSVRWLDEDGNEAACPGSCSASGRTARFSAPMASLVLLEKAVVMEVSW